MEPRPSSDLRTMRAPSSGVDLTFSRRKAPALFRSPDAFLASRRIGVEDSSRSGSRVGAALALLLVGLPRGQGGGANQEADQ